MPIRRPGLRGASGAAMIEVSGLYKHFPEATAVQNVSLTVARGRVLALMGPNGAGKTTLARMLAGVMLPDAGSIRICGIHVSERRVAAQACVGYLPEGAPVYADMSVQRFLQFIGRARGLSASATGQGIERVCEPLGLLGVLRLRLGTLSKGFRRRCALAAAVLADPPVLVLDEPGDGMDPDLRHDVRAYIRRIAVDKAVIISTHMPDEAAALCTDVAVMTRGRIAAVGTPGALIARYASDKTGGSTAERLERVFRVLSAGESAAG